MSISVNKAMKLSSPISAQSKANTSKDESGFALGTRPAEKLTGQFGWPYQLSQVPDGYQASISFHHSSTKQ
ncbi:hypothetical protein [Thalassomonas haliotis]|uniref:Uncharacterized protein n=1 Tax=Thalassomonas haliotis TaxID=485448 RepID=A0ABY7VEG0_9GAMM|nr:hypothetical protein [Thalassomonas haliotis]WDE11396.1 hypothetical protein H3N35_24785 [Thalassomonas haliotis]